MMLKMFAVVIAIQTLLFSVPATATEECGVVIKRFDYMTRIIEGEENRVFVSALNTASIRDLLIIYLYAEGEKVGVVSKLVEGGGTLEAEFSYVPENSGEIEVVAISVCGGVKKEKSFVEVVKIEEPHERKPTFSVKLKETSVLIRPFDIDLKLGSSKVIEIIIETEGNKKFFVDVSGVPSDWVAYNKENMISEKGKIFVYLTPKQRGIYTGQITVYSETGEIFEKDFKFFVAPPDEKPPEIRNREFDVAGFVWSSLIRTSNLLLTKPRFFMAVTFSLFVFVLYMGIKTVKSTGAFDSIRHKRKKQKNI